MGTVIEPVPVTGFAANFSPIPWMAPPPFGRDNVGGDAGPRSPGLEDASWAPSWGRREVSFMNYTVRHHLRSKISQSLFLLACFSAQAFLSQTGIAAERTWVGEPPHQEITRANPPLQETMTR